MAFRSRRTRDNESVRQPSGELSDSRNLFRRSRTLTGSVSSRVQAATEDTAQLRSPRHKEKDLRSHRRRIVVSLVGVLVFVGVVLWLFDQLITTPQIIFQPASARADAAHYEQLVQDYLNENPLERFQFAFSSDKFSAEMIQRAPELSSAALTNETGFMRHDVLLGARRAVARWQIGDKQYYVDSSGISYERNLLNEPTISVRDSTGLPIASQQIIASTKMMTFIGRVVGSVESKLGPVKEVVIPPATLKEVDLIFADRSYPVKLNIDRDPAGQAADIIAALQYLDARGIAPEYVDARVEGKAFYK